MHSKTLFFSTLFAASVMADGITLNAPKNLVQCATAIFSWSGQTSGNVDFQLFTDCSDSNTDPIYTATNVPNNTWSMIVPAESGSGLMWAITDDQGTTWSDNIYVGGDAQDSAACGSQLKDNNLIGVTVDAAATTAVDGTESVAGTPSSSSDASSPTTQSAGNAAGVANAEQTTSASTGKITVGGALGTSNGASGMATPSLSLAMGLMGAALIALF